MPTDPKPERQRPSLDVPPSVLSAISKRHGTAPRVSLHEAPSEEGHAPVIDPSSPERSALPEGRGSYQLLGEIARGGMGVVLRGHDTDLGRDIAMKVLNKDLADRPDVVQRFVEEAQIGGQLQHPGIVPVYELGLMADDRPYFTMKLVKGQTLASLLADREETPSSRRRLLDVFESTCQTVAYAHSRRVIHRDLKPANIMVGAFGEVQVVDWGLAKVLARGGRDDERRARKERTELETVRSEGSSTGTHSLVGSVLGTPAYMPPEQARGQVDRLDERSDVFALGAILCEILTFEPPYTGEPEEILGQAAQAELDDAYARLDACPSDPALVALAKRCLVAAPGARPRSAAGVAEAVNEHLAQVEQRSQEAQVEAAEARVRVVQERKARRLTLMLASAVVLLIAVSGGGWAWFVEQERAELAAAGERARQVEREVGDALGEARLFASEQSWDAARGALARARSVLQTSSVPDQVQADLDVQVGEGRLAVEQAIQAAEALAERSRSIARLQEELADAMNPFDFDPTAGESGRDELMFRSFPAVFASHGFDVLDGEAAEVAASLRERGFGAELALFLDAWASSVTNSGDSRLARQVLALAEGVDPDPVRARLRRAVAEGNIGALRELAEADLSKQPAATLELLITSLQRAAGQQAAIELADRAILAHPHSARLHRLMPNLLIGHPMLLRTPEQRALGRRSLPHAWAAVALEPENASHQFFLGILAAQIEESELAIAAYRRAAELAPNATWPRVAELVHRAEQDREDPQLLELLDVLDEQQPIADATPMQLLFRSKYRAILWIARGRTEAALDLLSNVAGLPQFNSEDFEDVYRVGVEHGDLAALDGVLELAVEHGRASVNNFAWQIVTADMSRVQDGAIRAELEQRAVGYAQQALDNNRDLEVAWNTLAWAFIRTGDYEQALGALSRSQEVNGNEGVLADWLGFAACYAELGDETLALHWYERARPWLNGALDRHVTQPEKVLARELADKLGLESPVD